MTRPDPDAGALRAEQANRERAERERAAATDDPTEEHTHERRADKAAYLRDKLDEQAEAAERVEREP